MLAVNNITTHSVKSSFKCWLELYDCQLAKLLFLLAYKNSVKSSRERAVCQFTFGKAGACWDGSFDICFLSMLLAKRCTDMLNLIEVNAISVTGSDLKAVILKLVSQR